MRITERIRLVTPDLLHDQITVEDPVVLEKPFTYTLAYRRMPNYKMVEFVCENNREYIDEKGAVRMRLAGSDSHGESIDAGSGDRGLLAVPPQVAGAGARRAAQSAGAVESRQAATEAAVRSHRARGSSTWPAVRLVALRTAAGGRTR